MFTFSIKRKIRHSHIEVVEKRQRKIPKSVIVMHVQSFCFAYQIFFVDVLVTVAECFLRTRRRHVDAHARWKSKRSHVVDSLPFDSLRSVAGPARRNHCSIGISWSELNVCKDRFYPFGLIRNYSSSPNGLWVGRMGYCLRGHEGERNNCFSKIQLFGQKYRDETILAS